MPRFVGDAFLRRGNQLQQPLCVLRQGQITSAIAQVQLSGVERETVERRAKMQIALKEALVGLNLYRTSHCEVNALWFPASTHCLGQRAVANGRHKAFYLRTGEFRNDGPLNDGDIFGNGERQADHVVQTRSIFLEPGDDLPKRFLMF